MRRILAALTVCFIIGLASCSGSENAQPVAAEDKQQQETPRQKPEQQRPEPQKPEPRKSEPLHLFPVCVEGKWGYINSKGEVAIQPRFDYAEPFSGGFARVVVSVEDTGRAAPAPHDGVRRPPPPPTLRDLRENPEQVRAFIDTTGTIVIRRKEALFRVALGDFHEGLAMLAVGDMRPGTHGFIDKTGAEVIEPKFYGTYWFVVDREPMHFSESLAPVSIDMLKSNTKAWGYIDTKGGMAIEPQFQRARVFSEGLAAVLVADKGWGFIDKTGKMVIKPQFHGAWHFSEGLALVRMGGRDGWPANKVLKYPADPVGVRVSDEFGPAGCGKFGYVDRSGAYVIDPKYDWAAPFSEGLAAVRTGGKCGYLDKTGKLAIEARFDHAYSHTEGLAPVEVDEKWGYIDTKGKFAVKPRFDKAYSFTNGLAAVEEDGRPGYVDKAGKYVWIEPRKPEPPVDARVAEAKTISTLRTLSSMQEMHKMKHGRFGTLEELREENREEMERLGIGKESGYIFEMEKSAGKWSCTAHPAKPGETGKRSFYIDHTGTITQRACTGRDDPPADSSSDKLR